MAFDDIIIFTNQKQTKKTIDFAIELGNKTILILSDKLEQLKQIDDLQKDAQIKLKSAFLVKENKHLQLAQKPDYLLAHASREFIETKRVSLIYNAEKNTRKDKTHHRIGMNQVEAKLLAQKKKTYLFNLQNLFNQNTEIILGRMKQNKKILQKYGVSMACMSFAKSPLELRVKKERKLLLDFL